jgi:hypothetical protein
MMAAIHDRTRRVETGDLFEAMARACPACGRPNGDRATRCLYCSQRLPEPAADTEPAVPRGPATTAQLVILAPNRGAVDGKVEALSDAAALGRYEARLALQASRYRLLRKLDSERAARELSRTLDAAGVSHHVIAEAELQEIRLEPLRALRFRGAELELSTAGGGGRRVAGDELLLLVQGEIARARHQEARLATPRGASQPLTPSFRLHLYTCTSGAFDLDPENFDWDELDEPPDPSTLLNLKRLIRAIRQRAPLAELDEGFSLEPAVLSRQESSADVAAMLQPSQRSQGVLYDNEPQFRYYSRWRYLIALRFR